MSETCIKIWNPYFEELDSYGIISMLHKYTHNDYSHDFFENLDRKNYKRIDFVKKYSYAIPNKEAIETLVSLSPVIEIGAGSGYWAKCVNENGGEVLAFDNKTWGDGNYWNSEWSEVKNGSIEKILEYPNHTLFLCWPYMDNMAHDCVKNYKGKYVAYVGEDIGGCTANDDFFVLMEQEFDVEKVVEIPQHWGVHDELIIYKRKK